MSLTVITYSDPNRPGALGYAMARTGPELDALMEDLQRQGLKAVAQVIEQGWLGRPRPSRKN
jgi:hypothetical protein